MCNNYYVMAYIFENVGFYISGLSAREVLLYRSYWFDDCPDSSRDTWPTWESKQLIEIQFKTVVNEDYNLVLNDFEIKNSPFHQPSRGGSSFGGSARRSPSCAETLASGDQLKRGFVGDALRSGDENLEPRRVPPSPLLCARRWGCEGGGDIGRPVDGSPPLFSKGPPPLRTCATLVMRKL